MTSRRDFCGPDSSLAAVDDSFWRRSFCLKYSMDNLFNDHHRLESEEAENGDNFQPTRHLPWNSVKSTRSFHRWHSAKVKGSDFSDCSTLCEFYEENFCRLTCCRSEGTLFRYFTARNWEIMQKILWNGVGKFSNKTRPSISGRIILSSPYHENKYIFIFISRFLTLLCVCFVSVKYFRFEHNR